MFARSARHLLHMHASAVQPAGLRHGVPLPGQDTRARSEIPSVGNPAHPLQALRRSCSPVPPQRKFVETFGDRGLFGVAVALRSPPGPVVGASAGALVWLRLTTPASTSPCSAFCMTSTEFAKASI